MKRLSAGLAAVLLAVVLCCPAARAEEYGYYVTEADATIALPSWEDYYYLYPGMAEDNEDLAVLEMTSEVVDEILTSNGILFDALYYDASHEIAVQVIGRSEETLDYSCLTETERDEVARAIQAELEQSGYTVQTMDWLEAENAVWLVTELALAEGEWLYQCHTYFGSAALSFTASTATGAVLSDEIRQTTTDMALGTVFQTYRPAGDPEEEIPDPGELLKQLPWENILTGALIGFCAGAVVVAVIVVIIVRKKPENKKNAKAAKGEQP